MQGAVYEMNKQQIACITITNCLPKVALTWFAFCLQSIIHVVDRVFPVPQE